MINKLSEGQLKHVAGLIKAVISDVDGVFNDNRVLEGSPHKTKFRSYYDGQGVSLLRAVGIHVCLITNEKGKRAQSVIDMVKKWNDLPSSSGKNNSKGWNQVRLYMGVGGVDKVKAAEKWLREVNVSFEHCAYMGDDILDVPLLEKVALRAAPIQAEKIVKNMVDFISERHGGSGAFRDLANFILEAKGVDQLKLPFQ